MDTQIETQVPATITNSTSDNLKAVLASLTEQSLQLKSLTLTVRNLIKDVDKQSKEFDKLRNKKSRSRTERKASDVPSGITKPVAISDELAVFLGVEPGTLVPRNEVTKGVSAYVRKHDLSDPENRQRFLFGNKPEGLTLLKLLGNPEDPVTYFNLQRYLKHHYIQAVVSESAPTQPAKPVKEAKAATPATPTTQATPATPTSTSTSEATTEPVAEKKKTKIIVKKKKEPTSELTEES
jgi:hypothetical protein